VTPASRIKSAGKTSNASLVELDEREATGRQISGDNAGDQKSRNDEEDVDADEAA
jgi:hypothetical protein